MRTTVNRICDMTSSKRLQIFTTFISLLFQYYSYSLYQMIKTSGVLEYWKLSFLTLTIITIILTLIMQFLKKKMRFIFFIVIYALSLLKIYPMGFIPLNDILISLSVIILLPTLFGIKAIALFSCFLSAGFILMHQPTVVWNFEIPGISKEEIAKLIPILFFECFFTTIITWIIRENMALKKTQYQQSQSIDKLTQANLSFQDYANRVGEQEKVLERARVANDLHDSIGYTLVNIRLLMEAALTMKYDEWDGIQDSMRTASSLAKDGLTSTKEVLLDLSQIEQGRDWGLRAQHKLAKVFESSTGVKLSFESGNAPWNISGKIDYTIFHMIQEGMTNALRHGKATEIRISMWIHSNILSISIEDNGIGSAKIESAPGLGIQAMKSRIEQLNGDLIMRELNRGYYLNAKIPLDGIKEEQ